MINVTGNWVHNSMKILNNIVFLGNHTKIITFGRMIGKVYTESYTKFLHPEIFYSEQWYMS